MPCGCKTGCNTNRCSCFKNNRKCSFHCKCIDCKNKGVDEVHKYRMRCPHCYKAFNECSIYPSKENNRYYCSQCFNSCEVVLTIAKSGKYEFYTGLSWIRVRDTKGQEHHFDCSGSSQFHVSSGDIVILMMIAGRLSFIYNHNTKKTSSIKGVPSKRQQAQYAKDGTEYHGCFAVFLALLIPCVLSLL